MRVVRPDGLPAAVLFACTMNAVRSPIGAAILRHLAGHRVYVESAGVRRGEHDPFVDAVMGEIGIDVSHHNPHTLADLNDTSFDLIISVVARSTPPGAGTHPHDGCRGRILGHVRCHGDDRTG